jgi:O-antigen ligase
VQSLADMGVLGLVAFLAARLLPPLVAVQRRIGDVRARSARSSPGFRWRL